MAFGVDEKGKPMADNTCYEKLQSLKAKGCVQILGTERDGTKLRLFLPSEIEGLIPPEQIPEVLSIEEMDFFDIAENRPAILNREGNKCFYCRRVVDSSNYVIEHVASRPDGNNSYRNLVAACRNCNNRKGSTPAEDFLRGLYRECFLGSEEFEDRLAALELLRTGQLKPSLKVHQPG
ncbi:MAG: HNH endonuclease [Acidobacteria bacterium]|nr:HNH endonuclease [Acidobacteriota bacterium]